MNKLITTLILILMATYSAEGQNEVNNDQVIISEIRRIGGAILEWSDGTYLLTRSGEKYKHNTFEAELRPSGKYNRYPDNAVAKGVQNTEIILRSDSFPVEDFDVKNVYEIGLLNLPKEKGKQKILYAGHWFKVEVNKLEYLNEYTRLNTAGVWVSHPEKLVIAFMLNYSIDKFFNGKTDNEYSALLDILELVNDKNNPKISKYQYSKYHELLVHIEELLNPKLDFRKELKELERRIAVLEGQDDSEIITFRELGVTKERDLSDSKELLKKAEAFLKLIRSIRSKIHKLQVNCDCPLLNIKVLKNKSGSRVHLSAGFGSHLGFNVSNREYALMDSILAGGIDTLKLIEQTNGISQLNPFIGIQATFFPFGKTFNTYGFSFSVNTGISDTNKGNWGASVGLTKSILQNRLLLNLGLSRVESNRLADLSDFLMRRDPFPEYIDELVNLERHIRKELFYSLSFSITYKINN